MALDDRPGASSTFAGLSERLLTCASLSKAYGTPGLRIGWLTVSDPRLREQLRLAKFNSSICCGVLDEFLAASVAFTRGSAAQIAGRVVG